MISLKEAAEFTKIRHRKQKRMQGTPYFEHPYAVARILKQKGILELINSFNEICNEYKSINLYIAGDGNLLKELKHNNKNIIVFKNKHVCLF